MTSFYSYNTHVQGLKSPTDLLTHIIKIKPTWFLAMDGLDFALQVKAASPDTNVIHRNYAATNGDDDVFKRLTPQQWLDAHKADIAASVWLMTTCEPGWSQEVIDWHITLMKLCVLLKVKLVVGNFSVGTPDPNALTMAKPLLQLLADNSSLFVLGLHEYSGAVITSGFIGGAPNGKTQGGLQVHVDYQLPNSWPLSGEARILTKWHCGRFQFIVEYCKAVGIKPPRVVIDEMGFDALGDIAWWTDSLPRTEPYKIIGGFKTLLNYWKKIFPAWSQDQAYFKQLEYAANNIYENTVVEGALLYCYGHKDAKWESDDIEGRTEFLGYMEAYAVATNTTTPAYTPSAFVTGEKYTLQSKGGERTNVHSSPLVAVDNKLALIEDKTVVTILDVTQHGFDWWYHVSIETPPVKDGYISGRGGDLTFTPVPIPVVIPTPPPVIIPDVPPITAATVYLMTADERQTIYARIAAIQSELLTLINTVGGLQEQEVNKAA